MSREIKFRYIWKKWQMNGITVNDGKLYIDIWTIQDLEQYNLWDKFRRESDADRMAGRYDTPSNWKIIGRNEFTGLKDKNDKEIYEGDIIEYDMVYCGTCGGKIHFNREVEWNEHDGGFNIDTKSYTNLEVIGNIYENKELLK